MSSPDADPCRMCDRAIELGAKKREDIDCRGCKRVVPLMPENAEAVELIEKIGAGLMAGGQVNYQAIETAFNIYGVPKEDRIELFEKIHVYIDVMLEHLAKKMKEA